MRLGSSPDAALLRHSFSRERIQFAWELLDALPFSSNERREDGTSGSGASEGAPINRLYVQTLGQPLPPQDTEDPALYMRKVEQLASLINDADAVVVGIGSGMSTSAGYDFYHQSDLFDFAFDSFRRAHGFDTLFDGMYHMFSTNEEQWAFNAAVSDFAECLPVGAPYRKLAMLLSGKEHFVLTTNVDGQVPRAFAKGSYWLFQGDMRFLQCSQPCNDEVVHDVSVTMGLLASMSVGEDGVPRIPTDRLSRCPECNHLMAPWVRDVNFAEGRLWREQKDAYEKFVGNHLAAGHRVLFLELGVSSMTPAIIKLPFWSMTERYDNAFYVCVNRAEASAPQQLGQRGMAMTADLARVIDSLEGPRSY